MPALEDTGFSISLLSVRVFLQTGFVAGQLMRSLSSQR